MNAVIYIRTAEQAEYVRILRVLCRSTARVLGWNVVSEHVDRDVKRKFDNSGLNVALQKGIKDNAGAIVVCHTMNLTERSDEHVTTHNVLVMYACSIPAVRAIEEGLRQAPPGQLQWRVALEPGKLSADQRETLRQWLVRTTHREDWTEELPTGWS